MSQEASGCTARRGTWLQAQGDTNGPTECRPNRALAARSASRVSSRRRVRPSDHPGQAAICAKPRRTGSRAALSTILLAYEFGSGLGHLNRLVAVARRLAPRNRVVFALPDLELGAPVLARAFGPDVAVRPGIFWAAPTTPGVRQALTHTFADVIRLFGFGDAARLREKVDCWRALLDEVRPDLIVADFAPTLRIAAGGTLPTAVIGNGYTVPPPGRALPPIKPWVTEVPVSSRDTELALLDTVNTIRAGLGGASFKNFADCLAGDETFVCTLSEFDPYAPHRTSATTWPFNLPLIAPGASASERKGAPIFVYLPASHPAFEPMLRVLHGLRVPAQIYAAGADPRMLAARCGRHMGFLTEPADFARTLPQARVLVHHSGLGTAYAGMAAGTPQLVLPLNLEHLITARGLVEVGVADGLSANEGFSEAKLLTAVSNLLLEPAWMNRASAHAVGLQRRRDPDPLSAVVAACNQLLAPRVGRPDGPGVYSTLAISQAG